MQENEIREQIESQTQALEEALHNQDEYTIHRILEDMHPIDIAIALEDFDDEAIRLFFEKIDDRELSEIVEQAVEEEQVRLLKLLNEYRIIYIFSYMSKDNVVDILGNLPINRRKTLIKLMKASDQQTITQLLGYDEDSAGGIMTTEYIALHSDLTVRNALDKIREIGPLTEVIETIFVINRERVLIGAVDLRDIFVAPDTALLGSIMNENVISVSPETDQEAVSLLVSKYDLKAIPVVNKRNSMLGVITVDDIIDVIVEEHTEDMLHMGGVSKEEDIDSTVTESVKLRLPWLLVNLVTAFIASFTVGMFEETIAQVVALAAAMPIVAGMGGNAGSQTLSIVIRSIALGEANLKDSWRMVVKQVAIGVINGAVIGLVTGIILYFRYGNPYLGVIMFAAMVCNLMISGIFGFLIPLVLKALNIDPALASAIFLTTATDVGGFFIFLGLSSLFITYLV